MRVFVVLFFASLLPVAVGRSADEPTPAPAAPAAPVLPSAPVIPPASENPPTAPAAAAPAPGEPPAAAPPAFRPPPGVGAIDGAPAETMAWRELRSVVERERAIWDRLRAQPDDAETQKRATTDFRDVLTAYENILRASPDFAEAYAAYGLLLSRVGSRDSATKAFLRANKLNPNLPMVKNQLGNYLLEDGNYKEALPYYLMAIELEGDEPLYHYQLGTLLSEYGEFFVADGIFDRATLDAKMLTAFRRAAGLAPDTWGYIYRYAESFYDLEKPDWPAALAAWQGLERKAASAIERQTVQLHEANVLIRLDRRGEARALLDGVDEPALLSNRQKLVEELAAAPNK